MVTVTDAPTREEISLLASLDLEWIKLPTAAVLDVGPAAQTLGGLLKLDPKETFRAIEANAQAARVPITTCKRHRVKLAKGGWIINTGRQKTPAGTRKRRTCTIEITAKTNVAKREYLFLPWWACCRIERIGRLTWAAKVLLAVVMSRFASLKAAIERQDGTGLDADEFWATLENMGGNDQFRFSLDRLERDTGLHRESIVDAKERLASLKIIDWIGSDDGCDVLFPNEAFRVAECPAGEGRVRLRFAVVEGSKLMGVER